MPKTMRQADGIAILPKPARIPGPFQQRPFQFPTEADQPADIAVGRSWYSEAPGGACGELVDSAVSSFGPLAGFPAAGQPGFRAHFRARLLPLPCPDPSSSHPMGGRCSRLRRNNACRRTSAGARLREIGGNAGVHACHCSNDPRGLCGPIHHCRFGNSRFSSRLVPGAARAQRTARGPRSAMVQHVQNLPRHCSCRNDSLLPRMVVDGIPSRIPESDGA